MRWQSASPWGGQALARAASPCSRAVVLRSEGNGRWEAGRTVSLPVGWRYNIRAGVLYHTHIPPRSKVSVRWRSASPPGRAGARSRGVALITDECPER